MAKVKRIKRDVEKEQWGRRAMFVKAEPTTERAKRIAAGHRQNARWSKASLEPDAIFAECRTLETMSTEKLEEMQRLYGPLSPSARRRAGRGR